MDLPAKTDKVEGGFMRAFRRPSPARILVAFLFPISLAGCYFGDGFISAGGVVHDESGSPIAGATVTLSPADKPRIDKSLYGVTTNGEGEFHNFDSFCPIGTPVYIFRVEKDGFKVAEKRVTDDEEVTVVLPRLSSKTAPKFEKRQPRPVAVDGGSTNPAQAGKAKNTQPGAPPM